MWDKYCENLKKISLSKIKVFETVRSDNRLRPQFKQTLLKYWQLIITIKSDLGSLEPKFSSVQTKDRYDNGYEK